MCAERMQRILTAIMLSLILGLFMGGMSTIATVLLAFVIVMMLLWAFTNFCPSLWFFKKILPSCNWN